MIIGLFEMCNPHLISTEILSEQIRARLGLPVFSTSRDQLGTLTYWNVFYVQILSLVAIVTVKIRFQTFSIIWGLLLVELYKLNLSPRCQRTHRDNRRGRMLRLKQRLRQQKTEAPCHKVLPRQQSSQSSPDKRPAPDSQDSPAKKRTKISWPWACYLLSFDCHMIVIRSIINTQI